MSENFEKKVKPNENEDLPPSYAEVVSDMERISPVIIQPMSSTNDCHQMVFKSDDRSQHKSHNRIQNHSKNRFEKCLVSCGTFVCVDCCLICSINGCNAGYQ